MTSRWRSTRYNNARMSAPAAFLSAGYREGVMAIAYAGMHPEQVLGVLNFVGGWMGEGCSTAAEINGALFQRGGKFGRPTLWLYGQHDRYYSIEHSRSNFDVFKKAGGNGEFFEYTSAGWHRPCPPGISKSVVRGCRGISDHYWCPASAIDWVFFG